MRRIPLALKQRLMRVSAVLERRLAKLPIVDHRTKLGPGAQLNDPHFWGGRVRKLNLSRALGSSIVLKRLHPLKGMSPEEYSKMTAEDVIRAGKKTVVNYRKLFADHMRKNHYRLIQTPATAISPRLIAMPLINAPTLEEFSWFMRPSSDAYLKQILGKEWNGYQDDRDDYSAVVKRIRKIGDEVRVRLDFDVTGDNDIFFIGFDARGNIIFMLTADVQNASHLFDPHFPGPAKNWYPPRGW